MIVKCLKPALWVFIVSLLLVPSGMAASAPEGQEARVPEEAFGRMPDGRAVSLYTLINARGMKARLISYGAILVSLEVPDRQGQLGDVVLGFDDLESYIKRNPLFGAVVGRYANRIANASFSIDGVEYKITANSGKNHIHGGRAQRFDKVVWNAYPFTSEKGVGVRFTHFSFDGEEGFPGNLSTSVTYTLTPANELRIDYQAETDKPTVVNLTNHSYFNLAGQGDILGHELQIAAQWYTPAGEGLIPTGEIQAVGETPLDFRTPHTIGERIGQLTETRGYDNNYVLDGSDGRLARAARVKDPASGRVMEVFTTEPGMQLYTANHLKGVAGKGGSVYGQHGGVCLETQHFPDSPNKPHFPSTVLRPGQIYNSTTVFKFSAD